MKRKPGYGESASKVVFYDYRYKFLDRTARVIEEAAKITKWGPGDWVGYEFQKHILDTPPRERNLAVFKNNFVKNNATTIKVMARKNGIPPEVLAGILHTEAGGDPDIVDNVINPVRTAAHALPEEALAIVGRQIAGPPNEISAGAPSIQLRNVAKLEGRNPDDLDVLDRGETINRLQNDRPYAVDMAARHIREEILDKAYPGYGGDVLTDEQVRTIGYGYNLGYPHRGLDPQHPDLKRIGNSSYGPDLLRKLDRMRELLK